MAIYRIVALVDDFCKNKSMMIPISLETSMESAEIALKDLQAKMSYPLAIEIVSEEKAQMEGVL